MKRFYTDVDYQAVEAGWQVHLDTRPLKTVGGRLQIVPTQELAQALAAEWAAQGEKLDPASLVMRDQTDFAIDVVAQDPIDTIKRTLAYGETDTLCYRADPDDALFERQNAEWEPVLTAVEHREGVQLARVSGIVHRAHPNETLPKLHASIAGLNPFDLAGLHTITSLAASLCIGLEALENGANAEALWKAATLEEEWQADLWGRDEEAEEARARKRGEFLTAFNWTKLARA
jgi:chaperone required for assembly of F1-ATPase